MFPKSHTNISYNILKIIQQLSQNLIKIFIKLLQNLLKILNKKTKRENLVI